MKELFFLLSIILLVFLLFCLGFYGSAYIVKLYTGCSFEVAKDRIQRKFRKHYDFSNDIMFGQEVSENVKNIIGDSRYDNLIALNKTTLGTYLLSFGMHCRLPYIAICVDIQNSIEQKVIETALSKLILSYLRMAGYTEKILPTWGHNFDLQLPCLEIRYATDKDEERILDIGIKNEQSIKTTKYQNVVDDTEDEDLNG